MSAKIASRGDPLEPAYLTNLRVAAMGWGTVSGLAVSQRGAGANMSVDVASGEALINGTVVTKGSTTNVSITAAHASYDRYDLVVINSSGTISVIDGTTGSTSYANDYDLETNNAILLAEVYVPATDTAITDSQITDKSIETCLQKSPMLKGLDLVATVVGGVLPLLDSSKMDADWGGSSFNTLKLGTARHFSSSTAGSDVLTITGEAIILGGTINKEEDGSYSFAKISFDGGTTYYDLPTDASPTLRGFDDDNRMKAGAVYPIYVPSGSTVKFKAESTYNGSSIYSYGAGITVNYLDL